MKRRTLGVLVPVAAVLSLRCSLLVETDDLAAERAAAASGEDGGRRADAVAPRVDAAPIVDGAADGNVVFSCPKSAFFCDDFESGLAKWEEHTDGNGRIALVTRASHSPVHAFEASTTAGSVDFQAALRKSLPQPVTAGSFVLRAWMRFEGQYAAETALVKLRAAEGLEDMNIKITADLRLKIDADVTGAGDELTASKPVPRDEWVCVEWHAQLGKPGRSSLLVNGDIVIDAAETNVPASGYGVIDFGFPGAAGPEQRVLWDDVVVGNAPVGCP